MDKQVKQFSIITAGTILILILASAGSLRAEEAVPPAQETFQSKIDRLEAFKQSNPEAYQRWVEKHQSGLRSRLAELKVNDPQKYNQLMERRAAFKDKWSERLRTQNPEKYQRWNNVRRKEFNNRLENLKQNNPEAYDRWMNKRALRLERMRGNNPERYEQLMYNNPRLAEKAAEIKARREKYAAEHPEAAKRQESRREAWKQNHPDVKRPAPRPQRVERRRAPAAQNRSNRG